MYDSLKIRKLVLFLKIQLPIFFNPLNHRFQKQRFETQFQRGSLYIVVRMEKKKLHSTQKGKWIDETGILFSIKALKQEGRLERREWRDVKKKGLKELSNLRLMKLMAKFLFNQSDLGRNCLLTDWWALATTVQWALEEESNPCFMFVFFFSSLNVHQMGSFSAGGGGKWSFNSQWH